MKYLLRRRQRPLLASLLAILMLMAGQAVAANTMALPTLNDHQPPHCDNMVATDTASQGGQHATMDHQTEPECQCLTLCHLSATLTLAWQSHGTSPQHPHTTTLIGQRHDGIHRLPLRPPSLTV